MARTPPMSTWSRTRWRRNPPTLLLLFVALVIIATAEASGCKVEHCTRQFQQAAMAGGVRRGPSPAFCVILRQYSDCLRSTARSCRGHLAYHSTITLVHNWNGDFNCSYVQQSAGNNKAPQRNQDESYERVTPSPAPTSLEPTAKVIRPVAPSVTESSCTYQGRPEVTHCSFYGDPHLVTFNGEFQTCKVAGAWPLIDNAYLAVSVTNEAVVPGSAATATTKITIIIKGGSDCAPERTYEATVDSVPPSFVDGSQWGGPLPAGISSTDVGLENLVPVRIVDKEPGRHVEIHARHLGAILIVRQVGRYLTFSARLPRDIAEQGAGREGLQLCVKGCPLSERIDVSTVLLGGHHHHHSAAGQRHQRGTRFHRSGSAPEPLHKGMHRDDALALCREYNLTDYYLDSCMFDLITTGDPNFSLAASRAQSDYLSLLPEARLANRTWPLSSATHLSSSGGASQQGSLSASSGIREAHGPGRPFLTGLILILWSLFRNR